MAPLNGANDVEALYNGSNSHNGTAGSPAIQSTYVDSRSGKQVDVAKVRVLLLHIMPSGILADSCRSTALVILAHTSCTVCHVSTRFEADLVLIYTSG